MKICTVSGQIISTEKNRRLIGYPLLTLDILEPDGTPTGEELAAFDTIGVGIGERVLVTIEGDAAVQLIRHKDAPVDAVIVGVVDQVEILSREDKVK
ncbi:MAG: EutN/CcmL family microcompartment protein [Acidobacteria bacterium]|nr:EutN/CcmL family microcompartment protein [Acidobacteriota bacterium]